VRTHLPARPSAPRRPLGQLPLVTSADAGPAPAWAVEQRALLADLEAAALRFVDRYAESDGSLAWRSHWPGMDGSDDPYEGFEDLPMLYLLGGSDRLLELARRQWDAITWQWTEYGQVYREFDAYYDWMHHGESSALLYLIGMADPSSLQARMRARRFAGFYTGGDREAANYDSVRRLIRSPLNGSKGPRFEASAEDWSTHREVLDGYPPPFDDIPGVDGPLCRWTDDAIFADILLRMNERMTRGDVPLNLTATSMAAHAYMLTGDDHFAHWVLDYTDAWSERTTANGGITPDNVGLSGAVGENYGGKWWGGYYGWQWPHGAATILEPLGVGSVNAALISGDLSKLDLIRSQLDQLWARGHDDGGTWVVPNKHRDDGWSDYRPTDPRVPAVTWFTSLDPADAERLTRISGSEHWGAPQKLRVKGNGAGNSENWFGYLHGRNAEYPEQVLAINREQMDARVAEIAADDGDPAEWDVHHWQDKSPIFTEGLVQTMWGAPLHIYHGGLPLASVRYFDPERRRPGLPAGVAALVEALEPDSVTVQLVNLSTEPAAELIVQAGAFGEHAIESVAVLTDGPDTADTADTADEPVPVDGPWFRVRLDGSATLRLRLAVRRFAYRPSYALPWADEAPAPLPLIEPRFG
jgi:hypothetical protein